MCSTKNFIVEVIEAGEGKRNYILRELPNQPNAPAKTLGCFDSADEMAQFLDNLKID